MRGLLLAALALSGVGAVEHERLRWLTVGPHEHTGHRLFKRLRSHRHPLPRLGSAPDELEEVANLERVARPHRAALMEESLDDQVIPTPAWHPFFLPMSQTPCPQSTTSAHRCSL